MRILDIAGSMYLIGFIIEVFGRENKIGPEANLT